MEPQYGTLTRKNDIEKLEKIHRRGARFINKKILKELNLTTLEERRKQRLKFFYKVAEG
jgi:DNA polymerase elongation subunit (family B)